MRLLLVTAVEDPGEPEARLLAVARRLRDRGWAVTVTSPGEGGVRDAGFPWVRLDIGGPGHGEGARAVASWPRALRLAQRFDVVYLSSTVSGRLLPALRGAHTVLHVHDLVDRIPRHWYRADVVIADGAAVAARLDGLPVHALEPPGDSPAALERYAQQLQRLITPLAGAA
ncbi:MAG: hypothetical protein QOC64_3417 [Solirubrobacteraceae bacterium]|jgi:hypothetical protein|nr:hypothetical protein [Solirubrobacteraceae bacterium]